MGDSVITIIAIFLAAILMFVFPLMSLSERTDDIAQLSIQTTTDDFVDNVRTTGKLTLDDWSKFIETASSGGIAIEPEIQLQILDENPGVKTTQAEMTKIGENVYYNLYTSQVEDMLSKDKKIVLKEGDRISVTVKNTNKTIAQMLRNFFYTISGNNSAEITAKKAGIVTVNGNK